MKIESVRWPRAPAGRIALQVFAKAGAAKKRWKIEKKHLDEADTLM